MVECKEDFQSILRANGLDLEMLLSEHGLSKDYKLTGRAPQFGHDKTGFREFKHVFQGLIVDSIDQYIAEHGAILKIEVLEWVADECAKQQGLKYNTFGFDSFMVDDYTRKLMNDKRIQTMPRGINAFVGQTDSLEKGYKNSSLFYKESSGARNYVSTRFGNTVVDKVMGQPIVEKAEPELAAPILVEIVQPKNELVLGPSGDELVYGQAHAYLRAKSMPDDAIFGALGDYKLGNKTLVFLGVTQTDDLQIFTTGQLDAVARMYRKMKPAS
ncbi:MAG: hypothetical protein ABIJ08_05195 [Nanoarchaeota archaeon]